MKIKFLTFMIVMPLITVSVACSQGPATSLENREPPPFEQAKTDSYIVETARGNPTAIQRIFARYGVALVRPLGGMQFELRLLNDPGIDVLKRLADDSDGEVMTIQPNFSYGYN